MRTILTKPMHSPPGMQLPTPGGVGVIQILDPLHCHQASNTWKLFSFKTGEERVRTELLCCTFRARSVVQWRVKANCEANLINSRMNRFWISQVFATACWMAERYFISMLGPFVRPAQNHTAGRPIRTNDGHVLCNPFRIFWNMFGTILPGSPSFAYTQNNPQNDDLFMLRAKSSLVKWLASTPKSQPV